MANSTKASALVLPARSMPPSGRLEPGIYEVKIKDVVKTHPVYDEQGQALPLPENDNPRSYVTVIYPDGFEREHHALDADPSDLAGKIINVIKARFGVESVTILSLPVSAAGEVIEVEV